MTNEKIITELKNDIETIKPFIGRLITATDRKIAEEKMNHIENLIQSLIVPEPIVSDPINSVITLLDDLGIPNHLKGYEYMSDAIAILIEDETYYKEKVTRRLYPKIARKYNITPKGVERSIRTAIEAAWLKDEEKIKKFLKCSSKPTNQKTISKIAKLIRLNII